MAARQKSSQSQATLKRVATQGRARRSATRPPAARTRAQPAVPRIPSASERFPIVGIGASAGGLEALETFFGHMSPESGIAFVVVMHQPLHHVSLLPELLGRCTTMRVLAAADGMTIEPNSVYIAPSNTYLSILHATLYHLEPPTGASLHLPIDALFRALADDLGDRAVGIVLSGTGTDGTMGVRAIKGAAGMTMVQNEQSAKYGGMPRSALATGFVDYVLPPSDMPAQLLAYIQGSYLQAREPESVPGLSNVFQKILLLLRDRTGHDFSGYKAHTLSRRITRRMNVHQLQEPQQYVRFLQEQPPELDLLFKELLIGVTSFFRTPEAFDALTHAAVRPSLPPKPITRTSVCGSRAVRAVRKPILWASSSTKASSARRNGARYRYLRRIWTLRPLRPPVWASILKGLPSTSGPIVWRGSFSKRIIAIVSPKKFGIW